MSSDSSGSENKRFGSEATLGSYLRSERERRGLTLEQVSSATRINQRVLQSLESDALSELPAKPFIRGFVLSYCRFIGLDGREVFLKWEDFLDRRISQSTRGHGSGVSYGLDRREGAEQSRTLLTIVMGVLIVVGGGAIAYLRPSKHHGENSKLEQLKDPGAPRVEESSGPGAEVAEALVPASSSPTAGVASPLPSAEPSRAPSLAPTGAPSPSPSPSSTASSSSTTDSGVLASSVPLVVVPSPLPTPSVSPSVNPSDPLNSGAAIDRSRVKRRIIVKALADVWVRYQTDDRTVMKFVLRKGKILVLRGESRILLQVSNPKALSANINFGTDRDFSTVKSSFQAASGAVWFFGEGKALDELKKSDPFAGQSTLPKTSDPDTADLISQ